MLVSVFLADGFEEIEALTCVDILRRANINVQTVGVTGTTVVGAHAISVLSDISMKDYVDSDMIVLPGGGQGTDNLYKSAELKDILVKAINEDKYVAAICAAPTVLGRHGLLIGKKATCYPGCEKDLKGALLSEETVCTDGKLITSRGPGTTSEFALKLVEILCGPTVADNLRKGMLWQKKN